MSTVKINTTKAIDLVIQMMGISGKSGEEGRIIDAIKRELRQVGIPESAIYIDSANRRSPIGGEVGNLVVKLPGTKRGPRRLLMAHVDTIPLCVGSRPVHKGAFIHSAVTSTALGGDNRAGTSIVLNTVCEIVRNRLPHPPLTLFWPVQEEIGLIGTRYASLSKLGNPKLCFNWDGGSPNIAVIGATGDYNMEIRVSGVASHAGVHPELGVSAIAIAGLAIARLAKNGWHGSIVKGRHSGTSNIGVISGGDATNVVTSKLLLQAEARSHDPKFRKRIVDEFHKAFVYGVKNVLSEDGKTGAVNFKAELKYESFELTVDEPCVKTALAAVEAAGMQSETRICNGGLDANSLTAHGLPTVTLGCGQRNVHTVDETLHVQSYLQACRVALALATAAI